MELNRVSKERDQLAVRIKNDAKNFQETIKSTRQKSKCYDIKLVYQCTMPSDLKPQDLDTLFKQSEQSERLPSSED